MSTSGPNPAPSVCPRCGGPVSSRSLKGLCRRCLTRQSLSPGSAPPPPASGLGVSCPQCGHRIELAGEAALSDIRCDSCGTSFSVVDDQTANQSVASLGRVGQFEIVGKLGTGAFGTVWKARDARLDRWVAIKIPRQRHLEPAEAEKFLREARAAAQLHHPNIVSVFEVGREDDLIYIVCDCVEGTSLAERLASKRVGPREAARLCRQLAAALEHAHGQGVIHRDIKPGNILLDAQGAPHLTDFGLARREAGEVTLTLDGQLLGTPAYMSPEQARGEAHQADPRADLYSLGVVLFQLLTGELPFRGNTRMLVQQVIHDEPPSPRRLNSHVPRDLETICLKCLEKEPSRRYASARALGDELDRFLAGEPVHARPIGPLGRAWRWCRRKPVVAAMTGAVALLLLAVTMVSVPAAWRIAGSRKAEQREAYYSSIALAKQYIEQGSIDRALAVLWKCPEEYRHWEWGHLVYLCHQDAISLEAHQTNVLTVAFSADNRWLASQDGAGLAKIWDWQAKRQVLQLGDPTNRVLAIAFSPTGDQFAAAMGTNGLRLFSVPTWQELRTLGAGSNGVSIFAYSADGQRLATAGSDNAVQVWNVSSGQALARFGGLAEAIQRLAISPDGRRLVAVAQTSAQVWDIENGTLLRTFPEASTPATNQLFAVFADDTGDRFASVDTEGELRLWQPGAASRRLLNIRGVDPVQARRVFFSPDGSLALNGGEESTARLWDVHAETEQFAISERVYAGCFTPDARRLLTVGRENWATVWDLTKHRRLKVLRGHDSLVEFITLSRDGRLAATGDQHGTIKVWSASPGRELGEETTWHWAGNYSPDGQWIVSCPSHKGWVLRSSRSGGVRLRVQVANETYMSAAFSPDHNHPAITPTASTG